MSLLGRRSRKRPSWRLNLLGGAVTLVLACGLGAGMAWAYWSTDATPGGSGAAVAATLDQGATPIAGVAGSAVTVSWEASSLSDGTPVAGYVVKRYDVGTLTAQPVLSSCDGTITALTCTEDDVPDGEWVYSVTPTFATHWRGPESLKSTTILVDSTPPANAITLSGVTGNAAVIGDTVYYRGAAGGSFTLTNAVSDSSSGPASSTTGTLTGTSSGWSHTPSTVSTPMGGPFVSNPFSWSPGTSSEPDVAVTGRDVAGNTAAKTLTFVDDSTGPTGGSVAATGLVGTGPAYTAATSVSLSLTQGTDPRGVAPTGALLQRATATLTSDGTSDGVCDDFGAYATIATDPAESHNDTGLTTGCYSYRYAVKDTLGNTTTYTSGDVKVDTSVPSTPTRSFDTFDNTWWPGTGNLVYYRSAAASGSFTVTASATDPESGIAAYTFPTETTFGTNWSATPGDLDEMTYSWSGTPQAVTAKSIAASNHADKVSPASATFTMTLDNTSPAAGSVSYLNGATVNTTLNVAFTTGADTGSGLGTRLLQRASAPLTGGTCGTFTAFTTIETNPPASPYPDSVTEGNCYQYRYDTPDNVGNPRLNTSASVVRVSSDEAGPTGGFVSATGLVGTGSTYSTVTSLNLIFDVGTDPSGVATTGNLLQRASAPLTSTGGADGVCGPFGAFATVSGGSDPISPKVDGTTAALCWRYQYVVKDTLGNTTTYTSGDVKVDTSVPSTPTRSFDAFDNTWWPGTGNLVYYRSAATSGSFRVTASAVDAQSGIAAYTFPTETTFGTNWSATPGDLDEMTYSWSGSPQAVTAKSITATNHATLNSLVSTVFTPTVDNAAPTGGTVTYPHNGTPNTSVNVTLGTVTDAGSGVASRLLQRASAPLTGGSCGTFTTFSTIATNPVGTTYSDTLVMNTCYQYQYVVTDNLGNQATGTSPNIVKVSTDVTGPTGGFLSATGLVGAGSTYSTTTTVNLSFSAGTDPSGVATTGNLLRRASAPLTSSGGADGVCGTFGTFATVTGGTDPASPLANASATTALCWRYQYVVKDDLGNTTTYTSGDVKVDTSVPSTPARTFGSFSNVYWDGSSPSLFYRSTAATGSFTVTASGAIDAQSGISTYNFPTFGANWTSTPGAFGVNTYSWSGGTPAAPGARSVTASNHATLNSLGTTFTPTADSTAPTGGTVTYPHNGTPNPSVNVTLGTVTDAGSGVASRLLQRASAPLTGGTCGTFTTFSTIATNPVGTTYSDTLVMNTCYQYQYVVTDNLGNQATGTSPNIVKVSTDVTPPSGGSVTATGLVGTGAAYTLSTAASLTLDKGSDENGVATTGNVLRRATATLTSGGLADGTCGSYGLFTNVATDPASSYSNTGLTTGCYVYQYVVLDNLGNATTYTSGEVRVDTTAPGVPTRSFGALTSTFWNAANSRIYYRAAAPSGSFTVTASATDVHSGIASYTFPTAAQIGTNWTATPGALGEMTYSWTSTPTGSTARSITATNHANRSAVSSTFTPTLDNAAPSAGSVTYPDTTTTNTLVTVDFTTGTDSASGLGTRLLQRSAAPLTGTTCGTYDAFTTIATQPTAPSYADTVPSSGFCYQYRYVVFDNVGNQTTATSANVVKVSP